MRVDYLEGKPIHLPPEETIIQYLNREVDRLGITPKDIGKVLDLNPSNVSRLLRRTKDVDRKLGYKEANTIALLILKHGSPIPNEPISNYYVNSEKVEFVFSDEKVITAVQKMKDGAFTQLPVFEKITTTGGLLNRCLGIITDWTILRRMLHPIKSKENWLKVLGNMKIKDADVVDVVPKYPLESSLLEVAEGLMHHYAVLIEEENGKYGIMTRADFLKLFNNESDNRKKEEHIN